MTVNMVKLLPEQHLEFLSLIGGCIGSSSLHFSKYHIVGNHMTRLIHVLSTCMYTFLNKDINKQICKKKVNRHTKQKYIICQCHTMSHEEAVFGV